MTLKLIATVALLPFLLHPSAALADSLYQVNFTATATDGPLAEKSFSGDFTYDLYSNQLILDSFDFMFETHYTLSDLQDDVVSADPTDPTGVKPGQLYFLDSNGNDAASGTPDFYLSVQEGLPGFLYGFAVPGEDFSDANGNCPDTLGLCTEWEGQGTLTLSAPASIPEPATCWLTGTSVLGLLLAARERQRKRLNIPPNATMRTPAMGCGRIDGPNDATDGVALSQRVSPAYYQVCQGTAKKEKTAGSS